MPTEGDLNFARLDSEPAQLDLVVDPPEELDVSVGEEADKVAGSPHEPARSLREWLRHELLRRQVRHGGVVLMYAEGGRSRSKQLGHPKSGVGRLVLESGVPVVPVAIHGSQDARDLTLRLTFRWSARGRSVWSLPEIRLETGNGIVPVRLEREEDRIVFGRMEQPLPTVEPYRREEELLAALGVAASELPVELYDNGMQHVYVALGSEAEVAAVRPQLDRIEELGGATLGVNCFAGSGKRWKTRMFAPGGGVPEDPATGSAAGPLAFHLARHAGRGARPAVEALRARRGDRGRARAGGGRRQRRRRRSGRVPVAASVTPVGRRANCRGLQGFGEGTSRFCDGVRRRARSAAASSLVDPGDALDFGELRHQDAPEAAAVR